MARTKASVGAKLSCGKSSKARNLSAPPPSSSPAASSSKVTTSGNSYCPRPTPNWQSPITRFFMGGPEEKEASNNDTESVGSSATKRKKRAPVITSDTESDNESEVNIAQNKSTEEALGITDKTSEDLNSSVLSVTEERPPSPDPSSHKIVEYFELSKAKKAAAAPENKIPTKGKGKGKGKKTVERGTNNDDKQMTNGQGDAKSRVDETDDEAMSVEKENLKPRSNADKRKDDRVLRAEKRDLTEAEDNAAKRTKVA